MTLVRDAAAYAAQLDEKVARLRAEFRLWREQEERHYAMFEAGDKFTPVLI